LGGRAAAAAEAPAQAGADSACGALKGGGVLPPPPRRRGRRAPIVPASTQKVLTAAAALAELGPDHRYCTGWKPQPSRLVGWWRATFPLAVATPLSTDAYAARSPQQDTARTRLEDLADDVVAAGVTRVDGGVVGDDSRYTTARYVADWPSRYIDQNQTGPLSALSVDDEVRSAPPQILAQLLTFSDNQTAELVLREVGGPEVTRAARPPALRSSRSESGRRSAGWTARRSNRLTLVEYRGNPSPGRRDSTNEPQAGCRARSTTRLRSTPRAAIS
jgi:hypothetical protein